MEAIDLDTLLFESAASDYDLDVETVEHIFNASKSFDEFYIELEAHIEFRTQIGE